MARNYIIKFTPTPGATACLVEYRQQGTSVWTTPGSPANPTTLAQYPLILEENKTYYVAISAIGKNCTRKRRIITVTVPPAGKCCPADFTMSPDESYCYKEETIPPDVETSGICLAYSKTNGPYSSSGARLYDPGYGVNLPLSSSFVILDTPYWTGRPPGYGDTSVSAPGAAESVMNRDSVWVDADCNGVKDSLAKCARLQFTYLISLPAPKRVYVGLGGDNTFRVELGAATIVQCEAGPGGYTPPAGGAPCATAPAAAGSATTNINFNCWHIIPVDLVAGPNYLIFSAIGDGSVNDAFAAIVYDNTPEQILTATSDDDLEILFRTGDYKGTTIDIATCPDGWVLDTTGGAGNYVCRKITTTPVITC